MFAYQHRWLLPDNCTWGLFAEDFSSIADTLIIKLQLEEKIQQKVNDEYKEQITLQTERDLFVRFAF